MTAGARHAAVLLAAAARANRRAVDYLDHGCRDCPDLDVVHDLRPDGTRGPCSTSRGPAATRCGCRAFVPLLDPTTTL